ncbi:MAG: hypothetical protein MK066_08545 [Crocinitomicaceae bacterium]|nr:hypothetical protein [Crocinitomicaceae bacterium]
MTENILSLRSFSREEEANAFIDLLNEHDISVFLKKDTGGDLDKTLEGESLLSEYHVVLKKEDKPKAEAVLKGIAEGMLNDVSEDYYLFSFEDKELINVMVENHEWSEFDVALSSKILKERGVDISKEELSARRKKRLENLAVPEGNKIVSIVVGYIFAALGGFLGLLIGGVLWKTSKKLPNGDKVPRYSPSVREHGKMIFIISAIIMPIAIVTRILLRFE